MNLPEIRIFFEKNSSFYWLPSVIIQKLMWKDKFGSPRCERVPSITIKWLNLVNTIYVGIDEYWEQWLWLYTYHKGNRKKAEKTWGWVDIDTRMSTWGKCK